MTQLPAFRTAGNGQTSFGWQELDRRRDDRLFFAALVEGAIAASIASQTAQWCRESGLREKFLLPKDLLHISWVSLGDHDGLPEELVEAACLVGSMVKAKPFRVGFDRLSAFGGGALVLRAEDGAPEAQAFWRGLAAIITDSPFKPFVGNSFEPHVTLLRDKARVPSVRERPIDPIGWTVRDFVLIHSVLGQGRYEVVERWQLTGQDDAQPAM